MTRRRSFLFESWPRLSVRHPWRVLSGTLAVLIGLSVIWAAAGTMFEDTFSFPGTETQRLIDLLEERFPEAAGGSARVVVRAEAGLDDEEVSRQIDSLKAKLAELPEVEEGGVLPQVNSPDGSIALITVQYEKRSSRLQQSSIDALFDLREEASSAEFQVELGGRVARAGEHETFGRTELMGLAAAVIILLISFGSVVAMGLPIMTALLALLSGFLIAGVAASFVGIPTFTTQLAAMIGIGVGIDYALLVVTRFREGLDRGLGVDDAIVKAATTAGRSVLFAGSAVVIALLGLWAVGIPFIAHAATVAALVVGLAVAVALFVLPAILKVVGRRIDRWRIPGLAASAHESETGLGYRLSRVVQRAPLIPFTLSLAILLVLAVPVLSIRIGSSDAGSNPESLTSRRAYDLLSDAFGPGFNGPILVGFGLDDPADLEAVQELPAELQQEPGVADVSPVIPNAEQSAAILTVTPDSGPQDEETEDLVHHLRRVVPETLDGTGVEALVGGSTAGFIDIGDKITARLPYFFAAVIGLSFLLLIALFRSILVPLTAAAMNLLSIGAAYGVLVAIFQWGWFGDILGISRTGPIESFLPMMLFAILFGLSMDYEVFLVSRIKEEYLLTGNNTESVARGLSVTTRVISAAAAIMVAVFLSFALSDQRVIKEFGLGLAVAIFIDATLVRLILVPSIMQLLGDANWWFPRWLDRLVPNISVDAGPLPAAEGVEEQVVAGSE